MTSILGICGSLRQGSINAALLDAVLPMLPNASTATFDIGALPHYSEDLDTGERPQSVQRLLEAVKEADGILIVTPEYNYSVPGVLKNAIDWASRPAYRSPLAHKPIGILGASPGGVGTARAQSHLRQILGGTVSRVFPHPDLLVGGAKAKFSETGELVDERTKEHLLAYAESFVAWAYEQSAQATQA